MVTDVSIRLVIIDHLETLKPQPVSRSEIMWDFDMKNLLRPWLPLSNLWIQKGRWHSPPPHPSFFWWHLRKIWCGEWKKSNTNMHQINNKKKTACQSISLWWSRASPMAPCNPLVSAAGYAWPVVSSQVWIRSHFAFAFNSPWLLAPTSQLPTGANCCDWWQASRLRVTCSSSRRFPAPQRHLQSCQPSRGPGPDRPHWPSCPCHCTKRCGRTDGGISQVSTHSSFLALSSVYLKKTNKQQNWSFSFFEMIFATTRECKDSSLLW